MLNRMAEYLLGCEALWIVVGVFVTAGWVAFLIHSALEAVL